MWWYIIFSLIFLPWCFPLSCLWDLYVLNKRIFKYYIGFRLILILKQHRNSLPWQHYFENSFSFSKHYPFDFTYACFNSYTMLKHFHGPINEVFRVDQSFFIYLLNMEQYICFEKSMVRILNTKQSPIQQFEKGFCP